ncbi:MAG: hypothetical protein ACLPKE_31410 [Streptosporangiaceae bacterium]
MLADLSFDGPDSHIMRRTRFLQMAGACVLSERVIGTCVLKGVLGCLLSARMPGLSAHQPRQDAGGWRREVLPHRNWQRLAEIACFERRHGRGLLQHGEGQLGWCVQYGGQQRPEFGQPCIKLCLHGLRRRRSRLMRELFLAFSLRCIRPGGLQFCAVVVAHYLLYRLLIHALLSLGDALTVLPLTL